MTKLRRSFWIHPRLGMAAVRKTGRWVTSGRRGIRLQGWVEDFRNQCVSGVFVGALMFSRASLSSMTCAFLHRAVASAKLAAFRSYSRFALVGQALDVPFKSVLL